MRKNAANALFIGICGKLLPMFVLSGGLSFQELGYSMFRFSTPEFVLSGATPPPTPSPSSGGSGCFYSEELTAVAVEQRVQIVIAYDECNGTLRGLFLILG